MANPALTLAERLVRAPPGTLSALEALVGPLEVDFAGGEGMGALWRPPPQAAPGAPPVTPGLASLSVRYAWDMHHQDPRRPRELFFLSAQYRLLCGEAELEALLSRAHGAPRDVERADPPGRWREYGPFYLAVGLGKQAVLAWYAERPEWAYPRVQGGPRKKLLRALVEALEREVREENVLAAVQGLLGAGGASVESPVMTARDGRPCGASFKFTPALDLRELLDVLVWRDPVAFSGDVHLGLWTVAPEDDARGPLHRARVGAWCFEPTLTGWPRGASGAELPRRKDLGPGPCYDVEGQALEVRTLLILPSDG